MELVVASKVSLQLEIGSQGDISLSNRGLGPRKKKNKKINSEIILTFLKYLYFFSFWFWMKK